MAIYLVDYENVYIEGLKGLEQLGEEDSLHIFYTQNRCGLTFGLYERLTQCKAQVHLNEVSVSLKSGDTVKNALDIQLMMFTGYLIGTQQSPQVYIISKDKDFQLGTDFFRRFIHDDAIDLRILPSIGDAFTPPAGAEPEPAVQTESVIDQLESMSQEYAYPEFLDAVQRSLDDNASGFAAFCETLAKEQPAPIPVYDELPEENSPMFTVQYFNTVRNLLGRSTDDETVTRVCEIISDSATLVDLNNGLAKFYRDGQRAKSVYHKFKPKFEDLRHLSRARNKG